MRTLQEKYNGINEGKFTKDQFLRDARMEQPNLVTHFNGYDDAVKILKNRGMIREAYSTEESFKDYSDDALADMIINSSRFEGNQDQIARVKAELERRKQAIKEEVDTKNLKNVKLKNGKIYRNVRFHLPNDPKSFVTSNGGYMINQDIANVVHADQEIKETVKEDYSKILELPDGNYFAIDGDWEDMYQGNNGLFFSIEGINIYDKDGESIQSSPREFLSQFTPEEIVKVENVNEARLTNKSLTDYRYKPTNDMDKYPYEQILRGLRVELEGLNILGTPTPEEYTKALGKVLKNLEKDTIFYTNQVAGVKANAKRTDLMIDATPKNEVDKENGLKKAALKEAIKGVIKNILLENTDPDLYDQDEEREERANDHGDYGPVSDFGDYYPEPDEDLYEMQGSKTDAEYKRELEDYLEDNQIYGYTDMLFDILTSPEEEAVADNLADFLDDHQIYGYNRGLLAIFRDYSNKDYPEEDEIDYDDENFSDPFIDGDLEEATDTEADKNMVRKFMTMYETEPSKFEKLHKQAQVQASTTEDNKFKHLLSLINRAKAGALQSLANQDRRQADSEGMDESISLKDIL